MNDYGVCLGLQDMLHHVWSLPIDGVCYHLDANLAGKSGTLYLCHFFKTGFEVKQTKVLKITVSKINLDKILIN